MISIEIPTMGEPTLKAVLESIRRQTYGDYEVIALDSSCGFTASEVAKEFGSKVIKRRVGLMSARHLLHMEAKGDRALLLDSTRVMSRDCLNQLSQRREHMVVIGEREMGTEVLSEAIGTDKSRALQMADPSMHPHLFASYALPRYFSSELLAQALAAIKTRMKGEMDKVMGNDHKIIFLEASYISRDIGVIAEPLLNHLSNDGLRSVFLKSFRYGSSHSTVRKFYPQVEVKGRRDLSDLSLNLKSSMYLLYMVQALGFYAGWFLGRHSLYSAAVNNCVS